MILHKIELGTQIGDQGVYVNRRQADSVDVSGTLYADPNDGRVLLRADGWHDSRPMAMAEAADRLTAWANRLLEQADKLLREAAE
jgi:hypothetical protein